MIHGLQSRKLLTQSSNTPPWAEWVEVDNNDSFIAYADPNTIRKNRSMVEMWTLTDHVNAQVNKLSGKTYFSVKMQYKYDCQGERSRILAYSIHSGKMGGGDVIYRENTPLPWMSVPPASILESLWKFACGRP